MIALRVGELLLCHEARNVTLRGKEGAGEGHDSGKGERQRRRRVLFYYSSCSVEDISCLLWHRFALNVIHSLNIVI